MADHSGTTDTPSGRFTAGGSTAGGSTAGGSTAGGSTAGGSTAGRSTESASVGEVVDYVKAYAKQETIGPLRGAGRWLGAGVAGALLLGVGAVLILLGLLRVLQTEWPRSASGNLSWLSYLIVLVVCALLVAFAVTRINRKPLNPPAPEKDLD